MTPDEAIALRVAQCAIRVARDIHNGNRTDACEALAALPPMEAAAVAIEIASRPSLSPEAPSLLRALLARL